MNDLIKHLFAAEFGGPILAQMVTLRGFRWQAPGWLSTTDSFVVSPLFFPGGDIGELAVNGTVNDLAAAERAPRTCQLASSSRRGCLWGRWLHFPIHCPSQPSRCTGGGRRHQGRQQGHGDGIYINTTGIGRHR